MSWECPCGVTNKGNKCSGCGWTREQAARYEPDTPDELRNIIITTTHNIDGYKVIKYLGIESIEYVLGTGVFSEITSSFQDFFGARSTAYETKLGKAKKNVIDGLKYLAHLKGGNAVIGVNLNYTEFSGDRVGLIASGTIVQVVPMQ